MVLVAVFAFPSGPDSADPAAAGADLTSAAESARSAAERYLQALAAGDARTVLQLSDTPTGDGRLLTEDVLGAQIAALPITDVEVTAAPPGPNDDPSAVQNVVISARFGAQTSQTRIAVRREEVDWKLPAVTAPLRLAVPERSPLSKSVAVWGVATEGATDLALFPGAIEVSSANPHLDITAEPAPLLLDALTAPDRPALPVKVSMNETGNRAVSAAVDAWATACYAGNGDVPPGCRRITAPASTRVSGPGNYAQTQRTLDPTALTVRVQGEVSWPVTGDGTTGSNLTIVVNGEVNLAENPPTFTSST